MFSGVSISAEQQHLPDLDVASEIPTLFDEDGDLAVGQELYIESDEEASEADMGVVMCESPRPSGRVLNTQTRPERGWPFASANVTPFFSHNWMQSASCQRK